MVESRIGPCFVLGAASALGIGLLAYKTWGQHESQRPGPAAARSSLGRTALDEEPILDQPDLELRLIRKAEAVVRGRTSALVVVVERCTSDHNYSAILRTVEALGIQFCYIIDPPQVRIVEDTVLNTKGVKVKLTESEAQEHRQHRLFAQNATEWLTITEFDSVDSCVAMLREKGYALWVTDLSQKAVPLTQSNFADESAFPAKVAIVMGTEAVGCSQQMLESADCRIYLPLTGFADSLNLSVACALVIQQVLHLCPTFIANMSDAERQELREVWFPKLARQRLLTSSEKKERRRLSRCVQYCLGLQKQTIPLLTKEQKAKVAQLPEFEAELAKIEAKFAESELIVQDLVKNPPAPLTDARRCDDHRVTFVGKGTRKLHANHWKEMAATSTPQSVPNATSAYFRRKVALSESKDTATHQNI